MNNGKMMPPLHRGLTNFSAQPLNRGLLGVCRLDVRHEAQHLEQLAIGGIQIREHKRAAGVVYRFDNAQQYRDADAVDQLGLLEIDHNSPHTASEQLATLQLDAFASQLIQVVAGINNRGIFDQPASDFNSTHSVPPEMSNKLQSVACRQDRRQPEVYLTSISSGSCYWFSGRLRCLVITRRAPSSVRSKLTSSMSARII